jgi:hypothetical protein
VNLFKRLIANVAQQTPEKRRRVMKNLVIIVSALFLVASLSACASMGGGGAKVKCPACGHEFVTGDPNAG